MKKTRIDWCDATYNPVTGCLHGCEYCYARRIAERFGGETVDGLFELEIEARKGIRCEGAVNPYPYGFAPTFHQYRLGIPEQWTTPKNIFVCSMADLFGSWVPDEWIADVLISCMRAPQHRYLFLTKNPARYIELAQKGGLPTDENMWYGTTVTKGDQPFFWSDCHNTFVSVEPLMVPPDFTEGGICKTKWIIIGAETGKRKGKVIPEKGWIDMAADACMKANVPIFMKSSLSDLMGDDMIQDYPWDVVDL